MEEKKSGRKDQSITAENLKTALGSAALGIAGFAMAAEDADPEIEVVSTENHSESFSGIADHPSDNVVVLPEDTDPVVSVSDVEPENLPVAIVEPESLGNVDIESSPAVYDNGNDIAFGEIDMDESVVPNLVGLIVADMEDEIDFSQSDVLLADQETDNLIGFQVDDIDYLSNNDNTDDLITDNTLV